MNEFFNFIRNEADALENKREENQRLRAELNKSLRIVKEILIKAKAYPEDTLTSIKEADLLTKFKNYIVPLELFNK